MKLPKITLAENEKSYKHSSSTVYTELFWIFFTINIGGIGAYFIYFHGYLMSEMLGKTYEKFTKSRTKTLIFTTLDTSQLKKWMIMRVFIVQILCICLLIMQVDVLQKKWK